MTLSEDTARKVVNQLSKQSAAVEIGKEKKIRETLDSTWRKPPNALGCIETPREDAKRLATDSTSDALAVDCECIVEMYELLWRWGNLDRFKNRNFYSRFGFVIPESVVFVRGRAYAWYFISKKDGSLLRKKPENLTIAAIEKRLCSNRNLATQSEICATWIPMSSQFSDERSKTCRAYFLTPDMCSAFLHQLDAGKNPGVLNASGKTKGFSQFYGLHSGSSGYGGGGIKDQNSNRYASGLLQEFCVPNGVSNFLIRAVEYQGRMSVSVRTNRQRLIPSCFTMAKQEYERRKQEQNENEFQLPHDPASLQVKRLIERAGINHENQEAVNQTESLRMKDAQQAFERTYQQFAHSETTDYVSSAKNVFKRAVTFEGWDGLSSVSHGYERRCQNQDELFFDGVSNHTGKAPQNTAAAGVASSSTPSNAAISGQNNKGDSAISAGTKGSGENNEKNNEVSTPRTPRTGGPGSSIGFGSVNKKGLATGSGSGGPSQGKNNQQQSNSNSMTNDNVNSNGQNSGSYGGGSSNNWKNNKSGVDKERERHRSIDKIVTVAKSLMNRIKQERVRQLHFLQSHQYIALHFKIDRFTKQPNFIFASIIAEEEVLVQCQDHIVYHIDESVRERLPRENLLRGGVVNVNGRKLFLGGRGEVLPAHSLYSEHSPAIVAIKPNANRHYMKDTKASRYSSKLYQDYLNENVYGIKAQNPGDSGSRSSPSSPDDEERKRKKLFPLLGDYQKKTIKNSSNTNNLLDDNESSGSDNSNSSERNSKSKDNEPGYHPPDRRNRNTNGSLSLVPRLDYDRPRIPAPVFTQIPVPHLSSEAGRYEYPPPYLMGLENIKHPLIRFKTREEQEEDGVRCVVEGAQHARVWGSDDYDDNNDNVELGGPGAGPGNLDNDIDSDNELQ